MEMFLVSVGFYGIGVLTMLLPHGMQRAAHWLANLVMNLGFSHQVNIPDTEDCTIVWQDPNHFTVTGIDKQKVGQYAAEIRAKKPPEPYKGKGIRYEGEVVKHKEGKAGKGKK